MSLYVAAQGLAVALVGLALALAILGERSRLRERFSGVPVLHEESSVHRPNDARMIGQDPDLEAEVDRYRAMVKVLQDELRRTEDLLVRTRSEALGSELGAVAARLAAERTAALKRTYEARSGLSNLDLSLLSKIKPTEHRMSRQAPKAG